MDTKNMCWYDKIVKRGGGDVKKGTHKLYLANDNQLDITICKFYFSLTNEERSSRVERLATTTASKIQHMKKKHK